MSLPTIVPTGFAGDYTDFLKTKCARDGTAKRAQGTVSIPAATATDTIIGLFPFNAGMSFASIGAYNLYCADIDSSTNVTLDVGIAYQDTVQGSDALTLITTASTVPQSGGFVPPTATTTDFLQLVTTGNGWVVAQINAASTTTGSLTFNYPFVYDQPVLIA